MDSGAALDRFLDDYRALLVRDIDPAVAAAKAANPGVIPCGRGCAKCCAGMFAISFVDAALLVQGLSAADDETHEAIVGGAHALMNRVAEVAPNWNEPWRIEDLGWKEFGEIAAKLDSRCPVLGAEEECRLYDHRPRIARLQGVSWRDPCTNESLPDFCAPQFGDPKYAALGPQPMALSEHLGRVVEVQEEWKRKTGEWGHTFVAAAIRRYDGACPVRPLPPLNWTERWSLLKTTAKRTETWIALALLLGAMILMTLPIYVMVAPIL